MLKIKKILIFITISASLLASSGVVINHKLGSILQLANPETIIYNNSYQKLNNTTILENRDSSGDYHIYDVSSIKSNANLFAYINQLTVDNEGELSFDIHKIPENLVDEWNKTISQVNKSTKVIKVVDSSIKIFQNQNLSKILNSAYIALDSSVKLTLLQFGGANVHVLLTGIGGDITLVPNYQDLSESLAFFNISQAHSKNSKVICKKFALQFISKSSLKDDKLFTNDQYKQLLYNIIDYKTNITTFLKSSPITNNSKNYSVRYLLDGQQNIISLSYYKYDDNNLIINSKLHVDKKFSNNSPDHYTTHGFKLLTWKNYADSWNNFLFLHPAIFSDNNAVISYTARNQNETINFKDLSFNTNKIVNKNETSTQTILRRKIVPEPYKDKTQGILIGLYLFYDDNNIYEQFAAASNSKGCDVGPKCSINIQNWNITNIYKN